MSRIDDLELLQQGDESAFNEVLLKYRDQLQRMIAARLNPKLRGRLDASDVIQDTYVEAARVLQNYLDDPKMPVYLWLRRLAGQKLIQAHRRHLMTDKRDVDREQPVYGGAPSATSQGIAIQLSGRLPTPSQDAIQRESKSELLEALETMSELDREVLVLRHFEQLSGPEAASVLGISHDAVKKRYLRALDRLEKILTSGDRSNEK